jgi:hypothetical protein
VTLIVLLIPTKLQVEPESADGILSQTAEILGYSTDRFAAFDQRVYGRALDLCRQLDIEVIDALPALVEYRQKQGEELYFGKDWHLSPLGHHILAELIYEFFTSTPFLASLRKSELVPTEVEERTSWDFDRIKTTERKQPPAVANHRSGADSREQPRRLF